MKRNNVQLIVIAIVINILFMNSFLILQLTAQSSEITTEYVYDPYKTEENPLRGFFPYIGEYDSFPYSMEYFYIPLKDLMDNIDSYTFSKVLEPNLIEIDSRDHQAIFRVYLDYPDEPTGIPDFLLNGLITHPYTDYGGGLSPDYSNETLISILESLIEELGKQYDGDNRIGFIELGMLGFWGEWHTYPYNEWFPDEIIQNRILYAYDKAFNKTKLVVRYPKGDSNLLPIGYHDDSFCYETIGTEDYEFYNLLVAASEDEKWKEEPIGGEIYPDLQTSLWNGIKPASAQNFATCVELTHASWLLNHDLFDAYFNNNQLERAQEGALLLGYQFYISSASAIKTTSGVDLTIEMENVGSAPFYYNLNLGIFSNKTNDFISYLQIDQLLPNNLVSLNLSVSSSLASEFNQISFKLTSSSVKEPILFANEEVTFEGFLKLIPDEITEDSGIEIPIIIMTISVSLLLLTLEKRKRK